MEKINFINNQAPALNATNLNTMQDNIENAIDDVNIFKNLWGNGNISANRDNYYTLTNSLEAGDYVFSWGTLTKTSEENPLIIFYDSSRNSVGQINLSGTYQKLKLTGTATQYRFYPAQYYDSSAGQTATLEKIQVEKGTSMTSYKPFVPKNVETELNKRTEIVFRSFGNTAQETYTFDLTKNALYLLIIDVGSNSCLVDIVMTKYNTLTKTTIKNDEANWINISYSDDGTVRFSTTYSSIKTIVKLT